MAGVEPNQLYRTNVRNLMTMEAPPEISFRHAAPADSERELILGRIEKLERFCDHITTCSVSVDREQKTADTGDSFRARVRVHVPPNHELVGQHSPTQSKQHVDLAGAINDAFDGIERQLRKLNELQNRKTSRG